MEVSINTEMAAGHNNSKVSLPGRKVHKDLRSHSSVGIVEGKRYSTDGPFSPELLEKGIYIEPFNGMK